MHVMLICPVCLPCLLTASNVVGLCLEMRIGPAWRKSRRTRSWKVEDVVFGVLVGRCSKPLDQKSMYLLRIVSAVETRPYFRAMDESHFQAVACGYYLRDGLTSIFKSRRHKVVCHGHDHLPASLGSALTTSRALVTFGKKHAWHDQASPTAWCRCLRKQGGMSTSCMSRSQER
jgi:hypothetical protein